MHVPSPSFPAFPYELAGSGSYPLKVMTCHDGLCLIYNARFLDNANSNFLNMWSENDAATSDKAAVSLPFSILNTESGNDLSTRKRKSTDQRTFNPWVMYNAETFGITSNLAVTSDENAAPTGPQTPMINFNPKAQSTPRIPGTWSVAFEQMQLASTMYSSVAGALPAPLANGTAPSVSDNLAISVANSSTDSGGSSGTANGSDDSHESVVVDDPSVKDGDPAAVFETVPGRLQLLGNNKKLRVHVAEVRRRIGTPECLNQSILSAILRRAKNKDGGKRMNDALRKHSISLTQGRRKSVPNSMFTALCEEEALLFGQDFHEVSKNSFPFKALAYEFIRNMPVTTPLDVNVMRQSLMNTKFILECFINLCKQDNSPLLHKEAPDFLSMHSDSQRDFTNYSLITHGFGVLGHQASWSVTLEIIRHILTALQNPAAFCQAQGQPAPFWA